MAGPPGIPTFERFFRSAAQLKMDKNDIKRYREFVDAMIDPRSLAWADVVARIFSVRRPPQGFSE